MTLYTTPFKFHFNTTAPSARREQGKKAGVVGLPSAAARRAGGGSHAGARLAARGEGTDTSGQRASEARGSAGAATPRTPKRKQF